MAQPHPQPRDPQRYRRLPQPCYRGGGGTGYLGAAFGENGWACKCIEPP